VRSSRVGRSSLTVPWMILGLCVLLAGCSHFEQFRGPVAQTQELIGYEVRVTTTEGRVMRFVLRDVTESKLLGDHHAILMEDVAKVERWHFSLLRTALLFVGLAGLYALPVLWM